jgi:hypothetical protein
MARTNLTGPQLAVSYDPNNAEGVNVQAAYGWTTSDGDQATRSRDITANLTVLQRQNAKTWLDNIAARIKTVDNIT